MLGAHDRTADAALRQALWALLVVVVPLMGVVVATSVGAVLGQTGGFLNRKALIPDLGRISPMRGLSRIFGWDGVVTLAKALAKVVVLGWAVWRATSGVVTQALAPNEWSVSVLLDRMLRDLAYLALLVLACQAIIAVADFGWTRFQFHRRLRMSAQDIKDEYKEAEGDPRLKARLRQIRLTRAKRRMMAAIPKATVVITNPTHYAVALTYDRGAQAAPRIVAKGVDDVAARIRAVATEHGIPLVANPPLARALHALPIDSEVPAEHFKAVAEIIAYVWRLRRHMPQESRPR